MRVFSLAVMAAASLGLTACDLNGSSSDRKEPGVHVSGREGDQTITVNQGGEQMVIRQGDAAADVSDVPVFARPYPGSTVTQSVDAGQGRLIEFETADNPDTVIEYYRQRAEEAGLSSNATMTMGDTRMYAANADAQGSLQVMVAPANGRSRVTVTWAQTG